MFLFSYAYRSPTLNLQAQSVALRAGYLLADEICACGDLYFSIFIEKEYNTQNPLFAAELMLKGEKNPESIQALQDGIKILKQLKAMKHKPSKMIVTQKQIEKMIMQLWQEFRTELIAHSLATGLPELSKIPETDNLGILGSSSVNAEEDDEYNMPCSKVLLLNMENELVPTEKCYFMLPHEYTAMLDADKNKGFDFNNWNEPNLTFYNLNILTASELMLVRTQLRPAAQPFCEAIDKWSAMIPTFINHAQSYAWYQQFVKPAAAALQQAIDANEILSSIPRLSGIDVQTTFHIGEAPTQAIWLFYDFHQNIAENTKKKLQKPEAKAFAAKRKPYFAMGFIHNPATNPQPPDSADEITPVKKSISFD